MVSANEYYSNLPETEDKGVKKEGLNIAWVILALFALLLILYFAL